MRRVIVVEVKDGDPRLLASLPVSAPRRTYQPRKATTSLLRAQKPGMRRRLRELLDRLEWEERQRGEGENRV